MEKKNFDNNIKVIEKSTRIFLSTRIWWQRNNLVIKKWV